VSAGGHHPDSAPALDDAPPARVGPFAAFGNPGYPFFWSSSVLASMGITTQTAIAQWQVYTLTDSAFQLGLVGLMNVLPVILFGVFGGAFADVADRRKLVAISQVVRIGIVASLAALTLAGAVQVWQIYLAGLLGSLASAFDQPARQAMIFSLVPRHHLLNAVTWHNVQRDAANMIGPAIAGIVMATLSISAAYWIDACLFVPLIIAMTRLHVGGTVAARAGARTLLRDGFRFLQRSPVIMTALALDFCLTFFGAYRALFALYARDILMVGPQGFGFLTSAVAVGGILGSSFVLSLGDSQRKGQLQLAAMLVYAAGVVAFAFSALFPLSLLIVSVLGFCDTVAGTMRRSIVQLKTPEAFQGRVGAMQVIVGQGGPAMGAVQAGTMATLIGAPAALAFGAAACGLIGLVTAVRSRSFRTA
jgi:MFS family permease